jgi:hypothetical protein
VFEILRDPDDLGAVVAQPPQHVHAYGVEGHQIREVESEPAGRFRADALQLAHLSLREPPGEVHGATAGHLHHPNTALHAEMTGKTDTNIGRGGIARKRCCNGVKTRCPCVLD